MDIQPADMPRDVALAVVAISRFCDGGEPITSETALHALGSHRMVTIAAALEAIDRCSNTAIVDAAEVLTRWLH